jgi:outer membrane receptor protein involved in Fe transport
MFSELKWAATAAAIALIPAAGLAQPTDKPPPKSATSKAVDEVVITGQSQQADRVEIDRRSYAVDKNVQAQSGVLSDLLRTVPSVDVDAQGNVSLRGDQNVTIMIDGKPSGMFSGQARTSAVQSLPAEQFERVEVITNPSAADSPEGVGGIINLISKQTRKAGGFGSVRASVGTRGQYGAGVSGGYNSAALALTGDINLRKRDPQTFTAAESRRQTTAPGVDRVTRETSLYQGDNDSLSARLGADYDLDARNRIGVQVRASRVTALNGGGDHNLGQDGDGGVIDFDSFLSARFRIFDEEVSSNFRRKLGDDQELTGNLREERTTFRKNAPQRNVFLSPIAPDQFLGNFYGQTTNTTGAKADYRNPFKGGELKLGYDGRFDRTQTTQLLGQGPAPSALTADPSRSGAFDYSLNLNAAYATLSHKVGDLDVLEGLRVENSRTEVSMPGESHVVDLTKLYPSLHLSYPLGEGRKLSASYSRRVDRPGAGLLNPLTQYADQQTVSRGNPELRPQETDSYEVAYDVQKGKSSMSATLFYRDLHDAITQVVKDQGNGVLLFTFDNLGHVPRAGVSLAVNRPLTSKLNLSLSGDGYWTQVSTSSIGLGQVGSAYVATGRGSLTWTPTADDLFQLDGRLVGKTLTPQGSVAPVGILNLGYRRKLTPNLFANVAMQDALLSNRQRMTFHSPGLDYVRTYNRADRALTVTLTYNFGGSAQNKPRDPAFDFGGGRQ